MTIGIQAVPENGGWYYCTVTDAGGSKQWLNLAHAMKMFDNGKGGTTLVFVDGSAVSIAEAIETP